MMNSELGWCGAPPAHAEQVAGRQAVHSSHRTGGSGQLQRLVAVVGWASTTRSAARARSYPETRRRDWMDGRNILGRARAAGRGRGRSTSSYSRSVGGRLRRRLGSAVSSRSSLERENGSPVVRADRDVAFWTGARELGLVLRVCGDPWRCHGVAGCRAERPVDPWAPRLGSAGPRRARALLCTARASRPRERRARRAVRWFCLRGFTPIDSPSPRSAVPQWQERRASRGVASAAAVR